MPGLDRNRIEVGGVLRTGEAWSCGWHYMGATSPGTGLVTTIADLNEWAEAAYTEVATKVQVAGLGTLLSAQGSVTYCKAQLFDEDGLAQQGEHLTSGQVGLTTSTQPNQSAVVFSLRGNTPGARRRGRTYWPAIGAILNTSGRLTSSTAAGTVVAQFADMMQNIQDAAPTEDVALAVYSPTQPLLTSVSSIACGDVPDTQRRRRDKLVEAYSVSAYA